MTQQPLDDLFRAVFRDDAQLDFTKILLAGRNLYKLHEQEPHLIILTSYDTQIILQSLRRPYQYRPDTGVIKTEYEVSINFTLYVASNNIFQIRSFISRFFVVDDERVAYLPTMQCDGQVESLDAYPRDGFLCTGAWLNGNSIVIWDFADPTRNAMGIYQVRLENLLQRTGGVLEATGQMPNTMLRSRSIFSDNPRVLRDIVLISQLPERGQVVERSRNGQQVNGGSVIMEAVTLPGEVTKERRSINSVENNWIKSLWILVSSRGCYTRSWVWREEGAIKAVVALADGTATVRSLTEATMESFGEEQLFCIRASVQQDQEYPSSYIASNVLVTGLVGDDLTIYPIDIRDLD